MKTNDDSVRMCVDKILPADKWEEAAQLAFEENPLNRVYGSPELSPRTMALITSKKWKPGRVITVKFLNGTTTQKSKCEQFAKQWEQYANIKFNFVAGGTSLQTDLRVLFATDNSSWSYIGTDALSIPQNEETVHFGWLTDRTSDVEWSRVVLHEFGHALGLIHEHMSPAANIPWDRPKVYAYYMGPPNNWSKEDVDTNLFQKYSQSQTQYSEFDTKSIMLYAIDDNLTIGTFSTPQNNVLSTMDIATIEQIYPKDTPTPEPPTPTPDIPTYQIKIGQTASGQINYQKGSISLQFSVEKAADYILETTGLMDSTIDLKDFAQNLIATDDNSGNWRNAKITRNLPVGKYSAIITRLNAGLPITGKFSFTIKLAKSK